jgi:hypothetical protein
MTEQQADQRLTGPLISWIGVQQSLKRASCAVDITTHLTMLCKLELEVNPGTPQGLAPAMCPIFEEVIRQKLAGIQCGGLFEQRKWVVNMR